MSQHSVVARIKTVGLDLGDRFCQVCGLLEDGTIGVEGKVASRKEAVERHPILEVRRHPVLRVVRDEERGRISRWEGSTAWLRRSTRRLA